MENFRFLLFGIAGVSVIFWVAVIALWHTYMFPKFFNEDKGLNSVINQEVNIVTFASFIFITYGLSSSITTNS